MKNYPPAMFRLSLLLLLFITTALSAQPGSVTEREVNYQKQFIEAKREALLGKTDKAIGLFETLLEDQPDNDPALFELARLRYAASNTDDAIDAMREAYELRPNEVYAAFLAELYQSSGRYREGAELYAELIKRNPAEEENYLERAAFLVRAQDIKGAVSVYDELEKRIGVNAELARRKHALFLGTGDQKRAERELTALVEAFPRRLDYRHLLAGYYSSQNQGKKAEEVYREILRLEPADVRAQLALQDTERAGTTSGDDTELLALLARTDVELDLKIGKLLPMVQRVANTRDPALADRALRLAAELRRVHPDAAKAAALEGDLYYHSGRLTEAIAAYRATLELDETVYPVWEQLLAALYLDHQIVLLRDYAEQALDIFPNRPAVYVHYALGEAFRADFGEADNLLQQAQLMVSANPDANRALAALQEAFKLMEAAPAPPGDLELSLLPGGESGPLAVYLKQRVQPEASILQALDRAENTNALLLELLGDLRRKAGDKAEAASLYDRSRAAGNKSPSLARKLAQVKS